MDAFRLGPAGIAGQEETGVPDGLARLVNAMSDNIGIPLDILPELSERGVSGKMMLIVEGMPIGSSLSAGTNNWDNTWSLKVDELSGLRFIPSAGDHGGHTLTVRVLCFDADGFDVASTAALIDIAVEPAAAAANGTGAPGAGDRMLAEAEARGKVEQKQALEEARDAWQAREEDRLAEAKAQWEREFAERLARIEGNVAVEQNKRLAAALAAQKSEENNQRAAARAAWNAEAD